MALQTWPAAKDPEAIRDYGLNWAADIGSTTIVTSTWSVVVGDVTIVSDSKTDTTTTVRLSGGTLGETCQVLNHVVLSNGEEDECTCQLKIRAK